MLLHDARRAARLDADGDLVTLEDQDRSRWDRGRDRARASRCWSAALRRGGPVPIRCRRPSPPATRRAPARTDTDWAQIAALYEQLAQLLPTPVVELNHAVAVGMADGPAGGLALVEELEASGQLAGYHLLPATRADLLRRLGRLHEAAAGLPRGARPGQHRRRAPLPEPPAGGGKRSGVKTLV